MEHITTGVKPNGEVQEYVVSKNGKTYVKKDAEKNRASVAKHYENNKEKLQKNAAVRGVVCKGRNVSAPIKEKYGIQDTDVLQYAFDLVHTDPANRDVYIRNVTKYFDRKNITIN